MQCVNCFLQLITSNGLLCADGVGRGMVAKKFVLQLEKS